MNFTNFNSTTTWNGDSWIQQLRPVLIRYCRSLTHRDWEAEDLAQDTLVKVMDRIRAVPDIRLNKSYVFRTARNLWLDRCRKSKRQPTVAFEEWIEEPNATDDDTLVTRELLEQLMHRLMPKPFVIVLLCDVFGLTAKETGACINVAEGTVQVTLSRARKRLKQLAVRCELDSIPATRATKTENSFTLMLEAVIGAFRRNDPRLIYNAYLRLFESGSRLATIILQGGRLYFTFRDPDGNLLRVVG